MKLQRNVCEDRVVCWIYFIEVFVIFKLVIDGSILNMSIPLTVYLYL